MRTILTLIILLVSTICYSQNQIITISDTTIKDDPIFLAPAIFITNSNFIEGSNVQCRVFVACYIYPSTSIQGSFHAYIVPYTCLRDETPTEVTIWGRKYLIKDGKKYVKL